MSKYSSLHLNFKCLVYRKIFFKTLQVDFPLAKQCFITFPLISKQDCMQTAQVAQQLSEQHQELLIFLKSLTEEQLHQQKEGKWSVLQNLDHLLKSIKMVNPAVRKPSIVLRSAFGKPNRPARSYEALVSRYQERLAGAEADAPREFQAQASEALNREVIIAEYDKEVQRFLKFIHKVKESKLDRTLLPHPLLGKLLMREILYFMHYHTDHHFIAMKKSAA